MLRLFKNIFLPILAFIAFVPAVSFAFAGGDGSSGDPYQITNCTELQDMESDTTAYYVLNNNIDCSATTGWTDSGGTGFIPIGLISSFTGGFDGQGFIISDLFMNRTADSNVGLFAEVSGSPFVGNVVLENVDITGTKDYACVGGFVGTVSADISYVGVSGSVTGSSIDTYVGGITGCQYATVYVAFSSANVTATGTDANAFTIAGGLVGYNSKAPISEAYARGSVTTTITGGFSAAGYAGGLAGYVDGGGTVENSYATGVPLVTAPSGGTQGVGGLIGGVGSASITNSFYDTLTSGQIDNDGRGVPTTTTLMKTELTFTGAGWDFSSLWDIDGVTNDGYPFFQWAPLSDSTPPEVGISLSDYDLTLGETLTITFVFTEEPVGFDLNDVTIDTDNGTLGTLDASDPLNQVVVFTPTLRIEDLTNTVVVGTGWTDLASNPPSSESVSANFTISNFPPSRGNSGGGLTHPSVEPTTTPSTPATILGSGQCSSDLIITQNLRQGARDGQFESYNGTTVTQVKTLQAHINRILAAKYQQAAGPVDGIFGPLTKQGVQRLQIVLNDTLHPTPILKIDGIVGPFTKAAINNSCGL